MDAGSGGSALSPVPVLTVSVPPAGLIKYSELTEYLVRAVTGMQKELQEARCEASRKSALCASLEEEVRQILGQEEKSRCLQAQNETMRTHLSSLQHQVAKLKDEKCDLYMRYTASMEDKAAVNMRLHDLNLQVGGRGTGETGDRGWDRTGWPLSCPLSCPHCWFQSCLIHACCSGPSSLWRC